MKIKMEKGITLMVLVITIVVLLILASVTIAGLIGDKGIIKEARDAKEQTEVKSLEEQIDISIIQAEAKNEKATLDNIIEELIKNEVITDGSQVNRETGSIQTSLGYTIEGKLNEYIGIEEEPEPAKTLVQAFKDKEIKVGDYLNYSNPKSGEVTLNKEQTGYSKTQTYEVDQNTTWRVLGLSEDGNNLLLTSGSPLKRSKENGVATSDPYLAMGGAEGYYNCVSNLNSICAIYKNDLAQEARSITNEDIITLLGITVDKENGNLQIPGWEDLCGYGKNYTLKSGDYSAENYLKAEYPNNAKYQALSTSKVGDNITGTSYIALYTDSSVIEPSNKLYEMLFKDTLDEEKNAKSYWTASPAIGIRTVGGYAYYGPGYVDHGRICSGDLFRTYQGTWRIIEMTIKPLISLKSNVSVDELQVITASEPVWSYTPSSSTLENGAVGSKRFGNRISFILNKNPKAKALGFYTDLSV